ncbi:hypothetical protein LJB95_01025 [Paludibacteraceae bacterium OttesenSCG-928-F17]|nr:hypothetical protein [Paludibacteraceae bacterium OttesenSCG-928-F17]
MSTNSSFYPNLGSLVKVNDFPESLSFMKLDKLQNLLNKIYYRHFQFAKSPDGSQASFDLNLIFKDTFDFDIFDTGFSVVLFPLEGTNTSGIDLSLSYTWPILGIINGFTTQGFDYSLDVLKDIIFKLISLSDKDNINVCMSLFEGGQTLEGLKSFVRKINSRYELPGQITIPETGDYDSVLEEIISYQESNSDLIKETQEIIADIYLFNIENFKSYVLSVLKKSLDDFIKEIITPKISASIGNISIGLAFPRNILLPISRNENGKVIMATAEDRSMFTFNAGALEFSTEGGIAFANEPEVNLNFDSEIGSTGIGIRFTKVKLDLSDKKNIAEANLAGRKNDFRGIYAKEVGIILPEKWFKQSEKSSSLMLVGRDILVGTGGLSGIIALEAVNTQSSTEDAVLWKRFGDSDFAIGFEKFNLKFDKNLITDSEIKGKVTIPRFKDSTGTAPLVIGVTGWFTQSGDFKLTADIPNGVGGTLFDLVTFKFLSMSFGREGGNCFISTSCEISFPEKNQLMYSMFKDQKIKVPSIRIYQNGKLEIEGGTIALPVSLHLSIPKKTDGVVNENSKPLFGLDITDIVYGSSEKDEVDYNYIGFDGAISIGPLGVDARGKGIKYYFGETKEGVKKSFLRLQTIELDLIIPGTATAEDAAAIIKGSVTMPNPESDNNEEREEYRGEISLSIPKINLSAGAKMRLNPKYPAFAVDAFLNLPKPIPIGPVGIYGFRGIVGYRYLAQKAENEKTWYDYFNRPPKGISIDKFVPPAETGKKKDPFAIGAGAVIGTSFDDGKIISARVMLLLSMPEMFTIEGKAGILSTKMELDDDKIDPPFYAFLTWATDAIEFHVGADLSIPKERDFKIITLNANIEARFPRKSPGSWYFNAGTREKPITASVLESIFDLRAQSFLMLSSQGMEAGARVDFEFNKSLLGIKVRIHAYVGLEGKISFERPQIGGTLYFGGGIEVNVWRIFYVSVNLDAALSMEVARPFKLFASLRVHGKLKVIGLKVPYDVKVKLEWEKDKNVDLTPICPLNVSNDPAYDPIKAVHMLTNETYTLNRLSADDNSINNINRIIPIDSYIDLKIEKGVNVTDEVKKIIAYPGTSKADSFTEKLPPVAQSGTVPLRQVTHTYSIEDFKLKAHIDGAWIDYHPYEASHPDFSSLSDAEKQKIRNMKVGSIQVSSEKNESFRLLTNNPFSYIEHGRDFKFEAEEYGITAKNVFCTTGIEVHNKINFLNEQKYTTYYFKEDDFRTTNINGAYFKIKKFSNESYINGSYNRCVLNALKINTCHNHNINQALMMSSYNSLQIDLPEKSTNVRLKLSTSSYSGKIQYYGVEVFKYGTLHSIGSDNQIQAPLTYKLLSERRYDKSELNLAIKYENKQTPIRRIVITPYALDYTNESQREKEIDEIMYTDIPILLKEEAFVADKDVKRLGELVGRLQELLEEIGFDWNYGDFGYEWSEWDDWSEWENWDPDKYEIYDSYNDYRGRNVNEICCILFGELAKYYPVYCRTSIDLTQKIAEDCMHFKNLLESSSKIIRSICEYEYDYFMDRYYSFTGGTFEYWMLVMNNPGEVFQVYTCLNWAAYKIMETLYLYCDIKLDEMVIKGFEEQWLAIHEIEYLTVDQQTTNEVIPGQKEKAAWIQTSIDSINEIIQPVWRPDTCYRIEFELQDNVSYENAVKSERYKYFYGFKTAKPIGYIQPTSELTESKTKKLNDLASYIDFNRSYPNADGNLLNSKPVFYGHKNCKIDIFFTKTYTSRLLSPFPEYTVNGKTFPKKDYAINIKIKDPVSDIIIPYPLPRTDEYKHLPKAMPYVDIEVTKDPFLTVLEGDKLSFWQMDMQPLMDKSMEVIQDYLNEPKNDCNSYGGGTIVPKSTLYTSKLTNLKPQKLYTALICNHNGDTNENNTIHEFVFKTSRYYSFKQQIESYRIKDKEEIPLEYTEESILLGHDPEEEVADDIETKDAIYPLHILTDNTNADPLLQKAYSIVSCYPANPASGIEETLYTQYPNPFDRVIEGLFEIAPMEAAIGTEFNILTYNEKTVGILIRNPEPFNNPRIPATELMDTIIVKNEEEDNINNDYKILHSKDYSQALIMYKDIYFADTDNLTIEFRYKLWEDSNTPNSGGKYKIQESIPVMLKFKQEGIGFWEIEKDFIVSSPL